MSMTTAFKNTPTITIEVGGTPFAYREVGPKTGVPMIFLHHLGAVLDNWDPRAVDGIAARRHVSTFDNHGVAASGGKTPKTIEEMAQGAVAFIHALGLDRVDLFGFSMCGMITQVMAETDSQLVRKLVLAGTGPAGGEGIDKVTAITWLDIARGALTSKGPEDLPVLHRDGKRQGGSQGLPVAAQGTHERPRQGNLAPGVRRPAEGDPRVGTQAPADLSRIHHPALVMNGDHDRMVPTSNTYGMARPFPNAELNIFPNAGHGGVFQYHDEFVSQVLTFLERRLPTIATYQRPQ